MKDFQPGQQSTYLFLLFWRQPTANFIVCFCALSSCMPSANTSQSTTNSNAIPEPRLLLRMPQGEHVVWWDATSDGMRAGYIVQMQHSQRVVMLGAEDAEYDSVGQIGRFGGPKIIFSRHGGRTGYIATVGGKQCAVIDSRPGPYFDWVLDLSFSEDGAYVSYVGVSGSKRIYVINNKESELKPDWMITQSSDFHRSPDGKREASVFYTPEDGQCHLSLNGRTIHDGTSIKIRCFSPDGTHLAYVDSNVESSDVQQSLIVDDKVLGRHLECGEVVFSPDSTRAVYVARDGDKWRLLNTGKDEDKYDLVYDVAFRADGKQVAYIARSGRQSMVIVSNIDDGSRAITGEPCDWVGSPSFGGNGSWVAYCARKGTELWWQVVPTR